MKFRVVKARVANEDWDILRNIRNKKLARRINKETTL